MSHKQSTKPTTNTIPQTYNQDFFKKRQDWRADYEAIANWVAKNVAGTLIGDIGCGNGYMIARLNTLGKKVWGVDAAENLDQVVDKAARKYVTKADLTQDQKFTKSDAILCFDVADRIDKKYADTLVKNIVSANPKIILFTASKPGQAGIHHINLQPREYWLEKFAKYGYYLDAVLNEAFKADLQGKVKNPVWYLEDSMILKKYDQQEMIQAFAEAGAVVEELTADVAFFKNKNRKLRDDLWVVNQRLNGIIGSARWKASSKLIRLIKK